MSINDVYVESLQRVIDSLNRYSSDGRLTPTELDHVIQHRLSAHAALALEELTSARSHLIKAYEPIMERRLVTRLPAVLLTKPVRSEGRQRVIRPSAQSMPAPAEAPARQTPQPTAPPPEAPEPATYTPPPADDSLAIRETTGASVERPTSAYAGRYWPDGYWPGFYIPRLRMLVLLLVPVLIVGIIVAPDTTSHVLQQVVRVVIAFIHSFVQMLGADSAQPQ